MKTVKKYISIITAALLIISSLAIGGISSFADNNSIPTIYSAEISAQAGSDVTIPIYIADNSGLLGWELIFDYDSAVLEPVSVSLGEEWSGTLSDTITGAYATDGQFKAVFQAITNNLDDGILMYATFSVSDTAIGSTNIAISYDQDNTYDDNFDDVELNCQSIDVIFTNSTYDNAPKLKVSSADIVAGEEFEITVGITDIYDLTQISLSIPYDTDNFEFIECTANSSVNISCTDNSGNLEIDVTNITTAINGEDLFSLKMKCDDFAYAGNYEIALECTDKVGADNVLITNGNITVIASETSNSAVISSDEGQKANYGETISVPLYINHNKGLCAYGLIISYDNTCLSPISISYTSDFSGSIVSNIGKYDDHIDIMWNSTDDISTNGKFLVIDFEVITDEKDKTTTVDIDYSPDDTTNAAREDVSFICNDVDILLNHVPVVTSINLNSLPTKLTYELYENFDSAGMEIQAVYDDESVQTLTDGYTISGFDSSSTGTKTITITYENQTVTFDVEVEHEHTWGEWQTVTSPNCVDKGSEKRACSVCGEEETRDVDPLGHEWESEYTVDVQPTCETEGSKSIHCSRCSVTKDTIVIAALGHNYESTVTKEPTCTEDGIRTYVCTNDSSHTYTETIEKLGHEYVSAITKEPTCEENGIRTYTCKNDSSHTYTEDIEAIGHDWELSQTIAPTCTEDGKEIYVCKNDSTHTKEITLEATGHTSSEWIVDKEATYLEDGSKHKECTVCHEILETQTISMLDDETAPQIEITVKDNAFKTLISEITFNLFFNENVDITISAVDSESGIEKIEYIKSSVPMSEDEILSCTNWTQGDKLSVCDEEKFIVYVKATDKQGNVSYVGTDGMVIDKTTPVISGITNGGVYCNEVTFTVSDDYLDEVVINSVKALSDDGSYTLTSANPAYEITASDKAGNKIVYTVTVNDGHSWSEWIIDKEASCVETGKKHRVCSVCGEEETVDINALGHDWQSEYTVDVEPTCETDGSKSIHCNRCNETKDSVVVSATGHNYVSEVIKVATCTESGLTTYTCLNDSSHSYTEITDPLGHTFSEEFTVDKEATCTEDGQKSRHCLVCDSITDVTVIEATGHDYELSQTIAPTCTEDGKKIYVCKNDPSHTEEEVLAATGHTFSDEFTVDKEATCTENGQKSRHCLVCDSITDVTVIEATGHNFSDWIIDIAPTSTSSGSQHKECLSCGQTVTEKITKLQYVADSSDNQIKSETAEITKGNTVTFTVRASGSDNTEPIVGDTRYVPVKWEAASESGTFDDGLYSVSLNTSNLEIGNNILTVTYIMQEFDGSTWNDTESTDVKSYSFTVSEQTTETQTTTQTTPDDEKTSDFSNANAVEEENQSTVNSSDEDDSKSSVTKNSESNITTTTTTTTTTTNTKNNDNVNVNTSKTSPQTGDKTVSILAVGLVFAAAVVCVIIKKKED